MEFESFVDMSAMLESGIYLLFRKGKVVYVGQSKCMLTRIYTHRSFARRHTPAFLQHARGIVFDAFHCLPAPMHKLDALEQELIAHYKPVHNIRHNVAREGDKINIGHLFPQLAKPKPSPPVFTCRL